MGNMNVEFPRPCGQNWDVMERQGINRHCARCQKTIHQLSEYTPIEAEALLQSGEEVCVRAHINSSGNVLLKPSRRSRFRSLLTSLAVTVSLLTLNGAAVAANKGSNGTIVGMAESADPGTRVLATDAEGNKYYAKIQGNGRFKIRQLPPGSYKLSFFSASEERLKKNRTDWGQNYEPWQIDQVVVKEREMTVIVTSNPNAEVIVGVMRRRQPVW